MDRALIKSVTVVEDLDLSALRARYASAVRTLQDIASGDYRGNRSHEQNLAYRTLTQLGEPVEVRE